MSAASTDGVLGAGALAGRRVEEELAGGDLRHRAWESDDAAVGITTARAGNYSVSMSGADALLDAYGGLARRLGFGRVAVPRQVHGTDVLRVTGPGFEAAEATGSGPAVLLAGRVDGLVTSHPDLLLVSTAADCVPVYLRDRAGGVVGLAHAGWRGVAGDILSRAVAAMEAAGTRRETLEIHLGPAICGACYEVDAPVLDALGLEGDRAHVDLRGIIASRAIETGVAAVTVSAHCTRCRATELHSHRGSGGQAGRMAAFIGMRAR